MFLIPYYTSLIKVFFPSDAFNPPYSVLTILEKKAIGGFWYCIGFFTVLYLQVFNRGILNKTRIFTLLVWPFKSIFAILDFLEALFLNRFAKDPAAHRNKWTVCYVYVARKTEQGNSSSPS